MREDAGNFRCLRKMEMVQNGMIDGKSMNYAGNHGKFAGEGCDVNWGWWDFLGLHGMLPCSVTFFFLSCVWLSLILI